MRKSNIFVGLSFICGIAIGVASCKRYFEKKYDAIAQEEIDSVKRVFHRHSEEVPEITTSEQKICDAVEEVSEIALEQKYQSEANADPENVAYLIDPAVIGENELYDVISFTYYSGDGVVADENDDVVENIDELVGADFADHFGEYEDDSVAFRNDARKCDFEILLDYRKWSDVVNHTTN